MEWEGGAVNVWPSVTPIRSVSEDYPTNKPLTRSLGWMEPALLAAGVKSLAGNLCPGSE